MAASVSPTNNECTVASCVSDSDKYSKGKYSITSTRIYPCRKSRSANDTTAACSQHRGDNASSGNDGRSHTVSTVYDRSLTATRRSPSATDGISCGTGRRDAQGGRVCVHGFSSRGRGYSGAGVEMEHRRQIHQRIPSSGAASNECYTVSTTGRGYVHRR